MNITFPEGAKNYYKVDIAKKLIEENINNPECDIWRCILCGYPEFLKIGHSGMIAATCCGGCGQTCMRPINEYGDDLSN